MEQYRKIFLVVVLAVLAWSPLHMFGGDVDSSDTIPPPDVYRSLRFSRFFDPKSIVPHVNSTTLTIYLVGPGNNPARDSLFMSDTLQRYATGRLNYIIRPSAPLTHSCSDTSQPLTLYRNAPCLAVFNPKRLGRKMGPEMVKCNYPLCKTMLTNDEYCSSSEGDVRGYFSNIVNIGKGYLPLGPRIDSWKSFQKIQESPLFFMTPASERKYAFNAIFSESTSSSRAELAQIIDERQDKSELSIFKSIAKEWNSRPNDPATDQLPTADYMEVLLDSVFTLAPAGHNPECFRIYEAVEAGSIPIILQSYTNEIYSKTRCRGSLHDWSDAPMVMLGTWDELYPKVADLMTDLEALDEMQIRLRLWYDEYMGSVVSTFENFMIQSYEGESNNTLMDS